MRLFLTALLIVTTNLIMAQQSTVKGAFLEKWSNSKEYLVEIAQSMPEELYNYRPTEREMTFKGQLLHVIGNMKWLSTSYFSNEKFERETYDPNLTKQQVLELLEATFDEVYQRIESTSESELSVEVDFFAGKKSKLQILNLLQDHVTHHRGQLIVYINMKGIKPPRYVGW
ncbi:DinB family protein [Nonlabens sp. MIC269]|uniref:DinB family protein n=1 Tax=Nonlabens sp. MIC269 TaxID=1476901 RepID=UPI00071FEF2D|nr:DinB family protein [Nonlabens sp. MIC269]ALM21127.1 DinB family protein [Nonlabens sp. MIC269]MEE2802483.1 DinB family protein [Bacteroidota bacterium]